MYVIVLKISCEIVIVQCCKLMNWQNCWDKYLFNVIYWKWIHFFSNNCDSNLLQTKNKIQTRLQTDFLIKVLFENSKLKDLKNKKAQGHNLTEGSITVSLGMWHVWTRQQLGFPLRDTLDLTCTSARATTFNAKICWLKKTKF